MEKLKNQLKWSKKQTAYAWAKYYQELRESHERVIDLYEYHKKMMETEKELPRHIVTDFENMCAELKKDIVCPICFADAKCLPNKKGGYFYGCSQYRTTGCKGTVSYRDVHGDV